LGILQELPSDTVVDKVLLVAGFTDDLGWKELGGLFSIHLEWKRIKEKARNIVLFHSDNDQYVPLHHGESLRDFLGAKLIVMKGQGHFSTSTDPKYRNFPELLEKILE
jgi:predicted alpha/beta hydrolase family esterase